MQQQRHDLRRTADAAERLRLSEERYRDLVESSHDWIWEVNDAGAYTYASGHVRELLGYEPEEVVGRTPFDFMPPEEARRMAEVFSRLAAARMPFRALENLNRHRDGRLVVIETNGTPILDGAGRLLGYRGMDRDITARKEAEVQTQRLTAKWRSYFDHAPLGYC